jgi:hypothetical protein
MIYRIYMALRPQEAKQIDNAAEGRQKTLIA